MNFTRVASTLVAFLALTAVPAAMAQDAPRSAAAKTELATLEVALRKEGIARALASMASRLEKAGQTDKAKLVRATKVSDAFARAHLDAEVETTLSDLFESKLDSKQLKKEDLKVDLDVFRGWRGGYRIRSVDAVPAEKTGFAPPRSTGFLPEVAALDPSAPHSMGDLPEYVADRFTNAALDRAVANGNVVELHVGSELEALADLKNRGWNVFGEVRSPNGTYERLFLAEGPKGEIRYVVSGDVDGLDRVKHLSALLRMKGVRADRIEVVGDVEAVKREHREALTSGFSSFAGEGTTAIVGFRMAIKNELTKRALAQGGAERLREVLGADPYEGLKKKLATEIAGASGAEKAALEKTLAAVEANGKLATGLRIDPKAAFASSRELASLLAAEGALVELAGKSKSATLELLVADEKLRLPGGGSANDYVASRAFDAGPVHADEIVAKSKGKTTSVLLVNNYYGDAMGDVTNALLASGRRKIAYFGTAGGLAPGVKIGDVHVPGEVYDAKLELASGGVPNALLAFLNGDASKLGERVRLGTKLANVSSPAFETLEWLSDVKNKGFDAVEVENGYIAREIAKHNKASADKATFYTSVIVSDVPGSEHTLGGNNGLTSHTFAKMVDQYVAALGIEGLELRKAGEDRTRPLARTDRERRLLEVADKLVPRELPRSSFLRDRIARILATIADAVLDALDVTKKIKPKDVPGLSNEARAELEAEVAGAYTDKMVNASLERANAVASLLATELLAKHPNAKFEIVAGGGVEAGAFSPVSGLVLDVRGSDAVRASAAEILAKIHLDGAPPVRLGSVPNGIALGNGSLFRVEAEPLVRLHAAAALEKRGALLREASTDYAGKIHRTPSKAANYDELAKLNLGELMVRARKELGRNDVPMNRTALLSLLTGLEGKELERVHAEWRARQPAKVEKNTPMTEVLDRVKARDRDKVRVR